MNADDELIVNLIVISKVQINTKLYTSGIYLNLEKPSYIPESIRRWIRQDGRDETIKKMNRIIYRSLDEYKRDTDKNKIYKHHLLEAKKGLLNLRETYSNCIQTVARIDTLISKIETIETKDDKSNNSNGKPIINLYETDKKHSSIHGNNNVNIGKNIDNDSDSDSDNNTNDNNDNNAGYDK